MFLYIREAYKKYTKDIQEIYEDIPERYKSLIF